MDDANDFSEFTRQSSKGVIILYLNLLYKILKTTWVLLFILIRPFLKLSEENTIFVYVGIAAILLLLFFRAFLMYKNFQFKIENKHFVLKQGILKKTNTSISFDRIQNINFKQNLIQQLINVYEVSIETAGSKKTEIAIKALSFDKAQALKEQISITKNTAVESGESKIKPLLHISFLDLLKVSLTENHLQSLLIFMALLMGIYQQIKDLFKSFGKTEDLDSYLDEGTNALFGNIMLFAALFGLLLLIAIISSFVRIVFRHFNLTVFVKNNAFEIHQGLTTKKTVILKKEKVQNITVSTNPIKQRLGISFVTFKQALSGKIAKKKDKLIRVVGCRADQIATIKAVLFDDESFEKIAKNHADTYFKTRMYFRSFIGLLLVNLLKYELHILVSHSSVDLIGCFLFKKFDTL